MKKIILFLCLFFLFTPVARSISASSYIAFDMDSNKVLFGSNIHDKRLIASTSKIMTCIIALEKGNLDDKIIVDKSILKAVGSSIYLEVGEEISLKDLLYGMMLRSGNDASTMIANHITGDMESFSMLMNNYARKLKMNDSYFYNSHGLENSKGNGNTSSSYDMAILTSYAMKNKTFRKIFSTINYNAKSSTKSYSWHNKNKLLKYDFITGGKTGYTMKANRTLVTTATINDMNIVVVTLNDSNDWQDHIDIYEKIKNNYTKIKILKKNDLRKALSSINDESKYYIKNDYDLIINKKDISNLKIRYYINNKDKSMGIVCVYLNDKVIYTDKIYVKKEKLCYLSKFINKIKTIFFS